MKLFLVFLVCAIVVVQAKHGKFPKRPDKSGSKSGSWEDSDSNSYEGSRKPRPPFKRPPPGEVTLNFHCECKKKDDSQTTMTRMPRTPPPTRIPGTTWMWWKKREVQSPPPKHEVPGHMKHFMEKMGLDCNCESIDIDGKVSFPLPPPHRPHGQHPTKA